MDPNAFHPDLRRAARFLPRAAIGPRSLGLVRALSALPVRRKPGHAAAVPVGAASVVVFRPSTGSGPLPALLWIHGGGYVFGNAAQDDSVCRHFAEQLGIAVAAVDYRLAPEHRFPEPLDDCYDALTWLARQPFVDPSRLAIGGASAGGGLAAGLALLARERGDVRPIFQLLAYPMLDDRTALRSGIDERHHRLWNNRANRFGWEAYTGRPPGSPDISDLAAPARADDLGGLPPAWIGVGTLDLFHDEDVDYAKRLGEAGVGCALDVVEGAFHGFDLVRPDTGVARTFRAAQVEALRAALGC